MPLNHSSEFADLTDKQYMAMGKAVVEWANIEYLLGLLLGRLLFTPDFLARTFTDSFSAVRLQEAIQEAVAIHRARYSAKMIPLETLDEIEKINNSVTALRALRNKIAHFCWCRDSDEQIFGTNLAGGIFTPKSERRDSTVLKLSELTEFNNKAFALVEQLEIITRKLPYLDEQTHLNHHLSVIS